MKSKAYMQGAETAANGGFRAMPKGMYKILSREWRDWYAGFDATYNPKCSQRAMIDLATARLNNMAG